MSFSSSFPPPPSLSDLAKLASQTSTAAMTQQIYSQMMNQQMQNAQFQWKQSNAAEQHALPAYGVHPECYSADQLQVVFYINNLGNDLTPKIETAYFPIDTKEWDGKTIRSIVYPCPAFSSYEAAQAQLVQLFRKYAANLASQFLQRVTEAQLERGMTADAECDLADALRKYLAAIEA